MHQAIESKDQKKLLESRTDEFRRMHDFGCRFASCSTDDFSVFLKSCPEKEDKMTCHIRDLPKKKFRKVLHRLLSDILKREDDYIETPLIVEKVRLIV